MATYTFFFHFYRAMLCIRGTSQGPVSVCLSVRLSVTSRSSAKTAKRRITQTTPHDSPGLYFSEAKDLPEIRLGSPPTGAPNTGWVGQSRRLSTNSRARKRYKIDAWFLLKSNRKSYSLYRMVTLPMTLSDP